MRTLILGAVIGITLPATAAPLKLAPHLADHMVVQRGKPLTLRGSGAAPGRTVTAKFGGMSASARADRDGRWRIELPAPDAGQTGTIVITSEGGETVRIEDVVAGDVWLCSGQSNMDLPVSGSANPERTMRESAGLPIRLLKVQKTAAVTPAAEIVPEIGWASAAPTNLGGFSAACWHMAREILKHDRKTSIGLIQASWGGSTIEDWMPPAALREAGSPAQQLDWLERYGRDPAATLAAAVEATDRWAETVDPGSRGAAWAAPGLDLRDWGRIAVPGQWERSGIAGLGGYDGVMWLRTSVTLSPAEAAQGATLQLGRIDERDRVWINGVAVGAQLIASEQRSYRLPPNTLKPGENSIVVRVIDEMGGGGLSGPASALALVLASGDRKPLAGEWRYRRGSADSDWKSPPPPIPWSMPRGLAMAWNGMVAPLADVQLRGIAWYQGESNTSRAGSYGAALNAWRRSWRGQFGDPALPVVLVQLPGYGPRSTRPVDAPWAQLREVQRLVAKDDAATGLAVAIDLGIPTDIHPAHKDVIGQRMGQEALRIAYGVKVEPAPQPLTAVRTPKGVEISLTSTGGALDVMGAAEPAGFELCDDAGACRFARANVVQDRVLVLSDGMAASEVRYAWQGSPPINLYARGGLPVVPFRLALDPGKR